MKVYPHRNLYLSLLLLLPFTQVRAQDHNTDTSIFRQAVSNAISYYNKVRGGPMAALYNGVEQPGYFYFIEGTAYFGSPDWQEGSVFYDGIRYDNIRMKYDQVKDLVLIPHTNGYTIISLFSPRVQSFTLPGHHFIYHEQQTAHEPATGFYEVLQSGKITLLARRTKKINDNILAADLKQRFEEAYSYYALKDGTFHLIRKESEIMDLVREKKAEIQKMLKSNRIKFRKNREGALIRIVQHYNQ